MKKVFLNNLPKKKHGDKLVIDWKNSIGYKVRFIYDDTQGEFEIIDYIKSRYSKIILKYNNKYFNIRILLFKNCNIGKILNKHTSEFKIEISQTFKDDKRDITIIDREKRTDKSGIKRKWYKYHCNRCGAELWMVEEGLLTGRSCACCCQTPRVVVKGINDINTTNPELVKYFVNIEDSYIHTYASGEKILCKCPNCGYKKEMKIDKLYLQGFSCQKCGDGISYPNKFMFNLLQQLGIEFKTEYSPKWIKPKRYDFYISSMKLIIEMDGGWHKKYNNMSGQSAKESKEIDNHKDKLAKEHGLEVIRIDCDYKHNDKFNYIKNNIINSRLNDIFNLNDINWINICLESEKSLLVEICAYWKKHNNINNEGLTTKDLIKIFNLARITVIKYLKKGSEIGLCNYNSNEELIKGRKKLNKNGKQVEIFKDGISLGIFKSCSELERQSEKMFDVKLSSICIAKVCNGKQKIHKGYTFKYI